MLLVFPRHVKNTLHSAPQNQLRVVIQGWPHLGLFSFFIFFQLLSPG